MKKSIFTILMIAGCLSFTFCSCAETVDGPDEEETVDPGDDGSETDEPDVDEPEEPDVEEPDTDDGRWFKMRGLVASWSDVCDADAIDYIEIAKANGINTFSIFGADRTGQAWKNFTEKCPYCIG